MGKHLVGRDALYEEMLRVKRCFVWENTLWGEALCVKNRFVCILVLEKMRITINAALWGVWNGCVSFQALFL